MTRFGVGNHLGVLEAADLISTVKRPWRYDTVVSSDWAQGSGYTMSAGDFAMIRGEVIEVDPPSRLLLTFDPC